jgi:hypothetical protein
LRWAFFSELYSRSPLLTEPAVGDLGQGRSVPAAGTCLRSATAQVRSDRRHGQSAMRSFIFNWGGCFYKTGKEA